MINYIKYTFRSMAALFVLLALTFTTACEEEEMGTSEVELLSFGPAGVKHGEEVIFIGTNLDKIASIVFRPSVEITKDAFTSHNSSQIKLNVPDAAEAGFVILNTTEGDTLQTKTMLNFDVPVVLSNITSTAKPGTNVTITGQKLNWIEEVTFPADIVVSKDDFVSQSLTELVVEVPMEAQTGFLIFASGGTEPMTFATESQLEVTLPAVTSIGPNPVRHTGDVTIDGSDLDLVTEVVFMDGIGVSASSFKSHSATQIVVPVPEQTISGAITLKQASPVDVTSSAAVTIDLPSGTSVSPDVATPGTDNLTIVGTSLDLVGQIKFSGADAISSTSFVNHSATQIVVAVPEGAKSGGVGYTTIHDFVGTLGVNLVVPGPEPLPLAVTVYDDEFFYGGQDWSWGASSTDPASPEASYAGSVSFKHVQSGADGGLQIGNLSGVDATGTGAFIFSLYGGPGTDGMQVAVILSNVWENYNSVTLVEGDWTEYKIDMASYPDVDFTNVNNIILKMEGTSGGEILYADRIGFDSGDPQLEVAIFDDAPQTVLGLGGGWGATSSDMTSTENPRVGSVSVKATFGGDYGGTCQFGNWDGESLSTDGMSTYAFSIYGGDGTDGQKIRVHVAGTTLEGNDAITISEGEWVDVEIPLSDFGSPSSISEVWFQDEGWSGTVFIDHIGLK